MTDRKTLALTLVFAVCCGCSDSKLREDAPLLERFFLGPSESPPPLADFLALPDTGRLAVDFGQVEIRSLARRFLFFRNEGAADLCLAGFERRSGFSPDFKLACLKEGYFVADCQSGTVGAICAAPGQNLVLQVIYAPTEVGADSGALTLGFNTSRHRSIEISISGEGVVADLQVCISDCTGDQQSPTCQMASWLCQDQVGTQWLVVDFGDIACGDQAEREIILRSRGQKSVQVSGLTLIGGHKNQFRLESTGGLPGALPPGGETQLLANYAPTYGGEHSSTLRVISDDTLEPEILVELRGRGMAPRVCPDVMALDFGTVIVGQKVSKNFTLTNCGLQDLDLLGVSLAGSTSPDFALSNPPASGTRLAPGQAVEVAVEYQPREQEVDEGGVDIFSNDIASNPATHYTGTISLRGRGISVACQLQIFPQVVNFGAVTVGQQKTVDINVASVGNGICTLQKAEITRNTAMNEFNLAGPPTPGTQIAPGDSLMIRVAYRPVNQGQDTGVLSIFADDKDTAEMRIDLNAYGVPDDTSTPVAVCSVDPALTSPFTTLTWKGDLSFDRQGRRITDYIWTIVSFPAGSATTIEGSGPNRTTWTDLAGQYSAQLVVKNDRGAESTPCVATAQVVPNQDLWIEMHWEHPMDDMDLHLLAPGGEFRNELTDCYFVNCVPPRELDWGVAGVVDDNPRLDLDDRQGIGPENINIKHPAPGIYTVLVYDFFQHEFLGPNLVTVRVYINGFLRGTFTRSISGEKYLWWVCTIEWPGGTVTEIP